MAYYLSKAVTRLGREADNDVRVPDDDQVSRYHAEIRRQGAGYTLTDRSKNGTFVGGRRISQHPLVDGDQIRMGNTTVTYQNGSLLLGGGAVASSGQAGAPARRPAPSPWSAPPAQQTNWTPIVIGAAALLLILVGVLAVLLLRSPDSDEDIAEEVAANWIDTNAAWVAEQTSNELLGTNVVPATPLVDVAWLGLPPQSLRDEVFKKVSDQGNWRYDRPVKLTDGVYSVTARLSFGLTNASNGRTINVVDVYVVTTDTVLRQFKELGIQDVSVTRP